LDLKQIKLVIDLMKRSDLTDFEVEEQGFKLRIRRNAGHLPAVLAVPSATLPAPVPTAAPTQSAATFPAEGAGTSGSAGIAGRPGSPANADEAGYIFIKSPMVGTFYRSASPESPPFAEVGAKVVENTVVCIIEAMKIMNEIQAEVKGTIVEVLVESGQPVEYGQRLFKVKQP
jgi:acetyl-CoA carboxylase biotin carboxyl carrier protein